MSTRTAGGPFAVAGCVLVCLAASVWGFIGTDVLEKGLYTVWFRAAALRFLVFLALAAAVLAAAARTRAPRATYAVLAGGWLCLLFGMAAVLAAGGLFIAALALGSVLAAPASLRERFGRPAGAVLAVVAGLAGMQALVQVLAHFPVNTPPVYGALAVLAAVAGRSWVLADARALLTYLRAPVEPRASLLGPALVLGVLSVHTVHAALPERMSDALAVHLAVPTYVASHQQWGFDPWLYNWALMPMGADWLFTASYLLGGEAATRLFNFGLHAAVVVLLYLELRLRLAPAWASVLAALYSATPLAFVASASLFVENALSLLLMAATVLLSRSWKSHLVHDGALLGLLLGASLETKLLAVFAAVALVPLAAYSLARSLARRPLAVAAGAGAIAVLITGGVPYIYAWAASGNPVLPMLNHVFRSPVLPPYAFADTRWMGHLGPGFLFEATFRSAVFGELWAGCLGFQHLLFLPAGILASALLWRQAPRIALVTGLVYCAGVLANIQYLRYLYPAFPLLTIVEAEAVRRVSGWRAANAAALALALSALAADLAFMPTSGWPVTGFHTEALFSSEARARVVDETVPQRRLLRMATAMDGRRVRVLEIGDLVAVDLEGEAIPTNHYNWAASMRLSAVQTEEDLARLVEDYGVNYVLWDQRIDLSAPVRSFLARRARPVRELGASRLYRLRTHPPRRER